MMKFFLILQELNLYTFLLAIIPLLFAIKLNAKRNKKNIKNLPEPAGSWPIIGHLHLLGGSKQLLHRTFGSMADELGPIFSVFLGSHRAIVVSDWKLAKECFTINDRVFPTRPKSLAVQIMGYGNSMIGFAPYGKYWRDIRKLSMVKLLSNHRLELLKHVRDTEIKLFIKELYEESVKNGGKSTHVVELKERLDELAMNIIVKMIAGKRYFGSNGIRNDESKRLTKALGDFLHFAGLFLVSDAVPYLGWLDLVKGYIGEMKRTAMELDSIFGSWVREHREKRLQGSIKEEDQDFIHVMLSHMDDGQTSADEIDSIIKAVCLSLILGGNDTTVNTLTWTVSLLLNNRNALEKAQEELDIQVGRHQQVDNECCIANLVYLQAIVKETLRLYPALPLSVSREAMEDCKIDSYHIPAGTRLFVNLWKMHRDPTIWTNPMEFKPERFLNEHANLDVRGQDFECIPFGSGRRMCPGVSFALQVLHLTLARLLHGFDLRTPSGAPVDMSESPGLASPRAMPLEVVLTPRLPTMC